MECYSELTPPTAVSHSIALPFVSAQSNNLLVAKSSLLQIFETKTIASEVDNAQVATLQSTKSATQYDSRVNDDEGLESSFLGGDTAFLKTDRANNTKLVLVAEIQLSGTVTGLARIKTLHTKSGGETLLMLFKDAKLSLIEWDPERHTAITVSIHYYEQEELSGSPWDPVLNDCVNFLAADPGSRCAALKFGAKNLAILPFKQADDDDVAMDDWDQELDGPRPAKDLTTAIINGASNIEETPYSPSFVLRLPNLDVNLTHPVHLAFLYEYREPTFGILASKLSPSAALGRRDRLTFTVFTLDLQQKASTTILSVGRLPSDLFRVIALPAPIGGALLVGTNELIHIDQSGSSNGVAVNPFTRQCTSFALADQSDLNLRLECCSLELMAPEAGQMLLVLADGRFAILDFQIDGRKVSGLHLKMVSPQSGGILIHTPVSSLTRVSKNIMFAGCECGDSMVFGWTRKQNQTTKRKTYVSDAENDFEFDEDDLEDDEDDLYAEGPSVAQGASGTLSKGGELSFRTHDRLLSIAPINDITFGEVVIPPSNKEEASSADVRSDLQLVAAIGRGKAGSLAVINREIQPEIIGRFAFPEARGLWTMSAQKPVPKSLQGDKGSTTVGNDYDSSAQHDKFMIVAKVDLDGYETSDVYALTSAGFESLTGTEFEPAAGFTVQAGTMGNHRRIIQVLKSEVRVYDGDLGLAMILPMQDEETGAEPRVISTTICDPYLLLIRDDASAFIAEINSDYELEEIEKTDSKLFSTKWLSGCLYDDVSGVFTTSQATNGATAAASIYMFLLSATGSFHIYSLMDLSAPVFVTDGLCYIPPVLSADFVARKGTAKETIAELLVADLGDVTAKAPYLILRHANDDLTIYEPRRHHKANSPGLAKSLFFRKLPNPVMAKSPEEAAEDDATHEPRNMPLIPCSNVGGYSTVFLPGASAGFILKSAKSMPKLLGLQGAGVRALSPFNTEGCESGFIYADSEGIARVTRIPSDCTYTDIGMSLKRVPLDMDIGSVAYHTGTQVYAVGCNIEEEFELPTKDDESNPQMRDLWLREKITFKPTAERGVLKLISASTMSVIDTVDMEPCEIIMCIKSLSLEISDATHERKELIVVGTAISKGEDLPLRGWVHVYDVASVIPEPGRPETNKKLKLVAKEDMKRGGVTALSAVGTQGFVLIAHGQKITVRGLKEDKMVPVAFMDMSTYVTSVKEIPGTGLLAMADAFKGVWFTGYTEEPYKMMMFGYSSTRLETLNVEFLPVGEKLSIIAADADGNIHVFEFDPDHPKSIRGQRLLLRTSFNVGAHIPTKSLMLPRTMPKTARHKALPNGKAMTNGDASDNKTLPPQILLLASPAGSLASLVPLTETSYRRLSSLASQLASALPHPAGLNPKAYRMPPAATQTTAHTAPGVDSGVGRNIVDGNMLARWQELASGRRAEIRARVGFDDGEDVRSELEAVLGWGGMAYF